MAELNNVKREIYMDVWCYVISCCYKVKTLHFFFILISLTVGNFNKSVINKLFKCVYFVLSNVVL